MTKLDKHDYLISSFEQARKSYLRVKSLTES